jgi:hypothetical protein
MGDVTGGPVQQGGEQQVVREVGAPLFAAKGWMKFLGVLMIIGGVMYALTIVGIIVCWLPIWMGVLLFQSASAVEAAEASGNKMELYSSLSKLKTYFTINGVLALIMIAFFVIAMFTGMFAGMMSAMSNY